MPKERDIVYLAEVTAVNRPAPLTAKDKSLHILLIRRAQDGDERAWQQLISALWQHVFYVTWKIKRRDNNWAADANDVVGRVFVRACERLSTFDPDKGNVSSWLFGIADWTCRALKDEHLRDTMGYRAWRDRRSAAERRRRKERYDSDPEFRRKLLDYKNEWRRRKKVEAATPPAQAPVVVEPEETEWKIRRCEGCGKLRQRESFYRFKNQGSGLAPKCHICAAPAAAVKAQKRAAVTKAKQQQHKNAARRLRNR